MPLLARFLTFDIQKDFIGLWRIFPGHVPQDECSLSHKVGHVNLYHWAAVSCAKALVIAEWAAQWWEGELREEFPVETRLDFKLEVIFDPRFAPRMGWRCGDLAVVNLAKHSGPPTKMKATLAEEIHHVAWSFRFGEHDPIYKISYEDTPWEREKMLYYALNPWEFFALRFVCSILGAADVPERHRTFEKARSHRQGLGLEV